MKAISLDIVVPCLNEEDVIERFYDALSNSLALLPECTCRIFFIDDGSSDGTLAELDKLHASDSRVVVYALSRNYGHQVALTAGIDVIDADAAILMDADLQHPPELIPEMVRLFRDGNDIVSAVRQTTAGVSIFKRLTSRIFYRLLGWLADTPIEPGAADFVLLSRHAYLALRSMPERHRFLRGMVAWIGFRRAFVPFDAPARAAGTSKYTIWRMFRFAADAILSFSSTPIRLMGRAGISITALGGAYLFYELVRYVVVRDSVRGWASLMAVVTILGGLQLAAMSLIGEYLARIFDETKRRPLYFFSRTPSDGAPEAG